MQQLVFIVGSYYPQFSAVGFCVHQVARILAEKFDVTVIAFRNNSELSFVEEYEGVRIIRVETSKLKTENSLRLRKDKVGKFLHILHRFRGLFRRIFSSVTIDDSLVSSFYNALKNIYTDSTIVIPVSFPFESISATLRFKRTHDNIRIIPYLFDNFVDNKSLHVTKIFARLKKYRHILIEVNMLKQAECVFAMHPLKEHYNNSYFKLYSNKIVYLEHPLLVESVDDQNSRLELPGEISLCFTGSLIRGYVEPDHLLNLLPLIDCSLPVVANFFIMGNAAFKVKNTTFSNNNKIINHGMVSKSVATLALRESDVLINIGEVDGKQVSSKIFEYIATGKPIIHFAHKLNDAVSRILIKYPLGLCINMQDDPMAENVLKVNKFLNENWGEKLDYNSVKAIYPEALPQTSADIFISAIDYKR